MYDPFGQEQVHIWQKRKDRIRDFLTDAYFGNNLRIDLLDSIIEEVLSSQLGNSDSLELIFNPEIAPWEVLFRQGELYESLPPEKQEKMKHHLKEIKVVLIKGMVSDQLHYIKIAKEVFSIADLRLIYERRIGGGKIGGKAASMLLAWKILQQTESEIDSDISDSVNIPDSYFIGSEVIYDFRLKNNLDAFMNQKYRPLEEIRQDHQNVVNAHLEGEFPPQVVEQLQEILSRFGDGPLIVRSSSLLEDNFGYSFAGKYISIFCPNQGSEDENLKALLDAIRRVYASTLNPDALLHRQRHGLIDYDERMAVLLQPVCGKRYGRYFMPAIAGVGLSENPFRWNKKIRREDGFLRLVCGMGTRAVDRVDNDYPRMIALSHPQLRPEPTETAMRQYAQRYIDAIDLTNNEFRTTPTQQILDPNFPELRFVASLYKEEFLQPILSTGTLSERDEFVLTFEFLTEDTRFIHLMRTMLMRLEKAYTMPVDVEFTVEIIPNHPIPDYRLYILQCRPLSHLAVDIDAAIPQNLPQNSILFSVSGDPVPHGKVEQIRYLIYIDPEKYSTIKSIDKKKRIGRAIGQLNKSLEDERFIILGPGRWGSSNIDLGVKITFSDIYNARVLVELGIPENGIPPELSYGTHFFQDLVESGIHSLGINLQSNNDSSLNWEFFLKSSNALDQFLPNEASLLGDYLRVIDVSGEKSGQMLNIYMDSRNDKAVGLLFKDMGEELL